jgi:hypothetical protein
MKTLLIAAALLAAPLPVLAQSVAAGTVPNSFDAPQSATAQPAAPRAAASAAQAPDTARAETALREVIAGAQGAGFDYSDFTSDLGTKIKAQEAQVLPLIKSFGAIKTVEARGQENGADLFRVTFDNQVTEWLIGFDAEDQIALLLFRPAEG